jgi:hypothetical protein
MTMKIYEPVNEDGLFNIQGPILGAIDATFTASGTTVQGKIDTALETAANLGGSGIEYEENNARLRPSTRGYRSSANNYGQTLANVTTTYLNLFYEEDLGATPLSVDAALTELIEQMVAGGYYVDANAVSGTTVDGTNTGDVKTGVHVLNIKGETIQSVLAEDITATAASDDVTSLTLTGERPAYVPISDNWPGGSALSSSLPITKPGSDILGQTDWTDDNTDGAPDNWIVQTGVPGTDFTVTTVAIQEVAISGTPTGGSYTLQWRDPTDQYRATTPLNYNASGSAVQSALRAVPGLENVTVSTTGTTPNFTHSVTMNGTPGGIDQLFAIDNLTGGDARIDIRTTRYADTGNFLGRALRLDSDGTTETDLYQPIDISEEIVYAVHFVIEQQETPEDSSSSSSSSESSSSSSSSQSTSSSSSSESSSSQSTSSSSSSESTSSSSSSSSTSSDSSQSSSSQSSESSSPSGSLSYSSQSESSSSESANEFRVQFVQEIEGQPVTDETGNVAEYRVDLDTLATGPNRITFFFATKYYPRRYYIRLHLNGPPANGQSVYVDQLSVVQAKELYSGGPFAASFSGRIPVRKDDTFTYTIANDYSGSWSTYYERLFGMGARGLRLPTTGTINVPDALIT